MTLEEIKTCKEELGYSAKQLAELSGVPLGTLQKFLSGATRAPRYDTRRKIEYALLLSRGDKKIRTEESHVAEEGYVAAESHVAEESAVYKVKPHKKQGEYTLDDYYAWPEDERIELIDGVIYDMTVPTYIHQRFAFHFAYYVQNFISARGGSCITMVSPVDVRLDRDNRTIVQPDALILCDKGKIRKWGIDGAPDFVLEVLSESTRQKDLTIKMKKYINAGVREYWILDPDKMRLYTYDFRDEGIPGVYPLEGEAGVGIFDGELKIPLDELAEMYADIQED